LAIITAEVKQLDFFATVNRI